MNEIKASPRVLLVEDDPTSQAIVVALLGKLDITPVIAKDGDEARSVLSRQEFDLIFMDITLPGASGLELCAEIRNREKGSNRRTFIVALTGMNAPDDRKTCLDAGMDGYFPKPLDRLKLQGFVRNLFKIGR
jgi:CheY-like chemotaxis protein